MDYFRTEETHSWEHHLMVYDNVLAIQKKMLEVTSPCSQRKTLTINKAVGYTDFLDRNKNLKIL